MDFYGPKTNYSWKKMENFEKLTYNAKYAILNLSDELLSCIKLVLKKEKNSVCFDPHT